MKSVSKIGVAIVIAVGVGAAVAQGSQPPTSRGDVKAETRALEKTHKLPAGEAGAYQPPSGKSSKTRADRKAETVAARRHGDLPPAGQASETKAERLALATPSAKTRSERKSETRAAQKAGTLPPAGERTYVPKPQP